MKEQRYTWNFEEIILTKKMLQNKIQKINDQLLQCEDKNKIKDLEKQLRYYQSIYELCHKMILYATKQSGDLPKRHSSNPEDIFIKNQNEYFNCLSGTERDLIASILKQNVGTITNYLDLYDTFIEYSRDTKIQLSNHDLIELAHLFYKDFFPNEISLFDELMKWQNHLLLFQYYKDIEEAPALGLTFSRLPFQKYPTAILFRNNSLVDLTTLIHELGHLYMHSKNQGHFQKNEQNLLCEVEGRLPEFACLYFLEKEGLFVEDLPYLQYCSLFSTFHSIHNLFFQLIVTDYIKKNQIDYNQLQKAVKHKMNMPFENFLFSIYSENSSITLAQDIVSDLAAFELADRYQKNPNEVQEIFQSLPQIMDLPIMDALDKMGCRFQKTGAEGYQKTMKRLQKEFTKK